MTLHERKTAGAMWNVNGETIRARNNNLNPRKHGLKKMGPKEIPPQDGFLDQAYFGMHNVHEQLIQFRLVGPERKILQHEVLDEFFGQSFRYGYAPIFGSGSFRGDPDVWNDHYCKMSVPDVWNGVP